jgi:5-methylcytosine-specific restriction endonuclease McrA
MESKVCSKCKRELPRNTDYFYKNTHAKDGYRPTCKQCMGYSYTKRLETAKGFKICNTCNKEKPATKEYFYSAGYSRLRGECKECSVKVDHQYYLENRASISDYNKMYYAQNKENRSKYRKKYYALNKDKLNQYNKDYYEQNKKMFKLHNSLYYRANKFKMAQQAREWREKNKDKIKEDKKLYAMNNRDICRQAYQRRAASQRKLKNTLTVAQWNKIKEDFNNTCAYCGESKPLTQDHFIPLSRGGEYTHDNIIPSCKECNSSKWNRNYFDWYPVYKHYDKKRERFILEYLNYTTEETQQLALFK